MTLGEVSLTGPNNISAESACSLILLYTLRKINPWSGKSGEGWLIH